jgi:DNA-directed RNA polymerase subunit RPC12/RpoP
MSSKELRQLEELRLCQLRMDTTRPECWVCADCGKMIDYNPEYSGRWIVCIECGSPNFIGPELVLN